MPKITRIVAREILDSRATPTIEVSIMTDSGHWGTSSAPSGASTGKFEAVELRDNDEPRYFGKGVLKAVENVNQKIASALKGEDVENQEVIDKKMIELDATENKSNLGANAILAVSQAAAKTASAYSGRPLFKYLKDTYRPGEDVKIPGATYNLINGGKHGAGNNLDFQEFHIIPSTRFLFKESLRIASEIVGTLKNELKHRGATYSVGDEGGFAPNLFTNTDALELLSIVIRNSPYKLNQDIFLGLDVAANSFYQNGKYHIKDSPKPLKKEEMINLYVKLAQDYKLFSIEDPLDEEDWNGWHDLHTRLPNNTLLVGDDLLTTNIKRLNEAIKQKACNTILVKPNQIGTVTETVEVIKKAKESQINTIFSHRSGETNDTFIADLAVGLGANYTKFGAPVRGERVAKYNRLLEIESYIRPS